MVPHELGSLVADRQVPDPPVGHALHQLVDGLADPGDRAPRRSCSGLHRLAAALRLPPWATARTTSRSEMIPATPPSPSMTIIAPTPRANSSAVAEVKVSVRRTGEDLARPCA